MPVPFLWVGAAVKAVMQTQVKRNTFALKATEDAQPPCMRNRGNVKARESGSGEKKEHATSYRLVCMVLLALGETDVSRHLAANRPVSGTAKGSSPAGWLRKAAAGCRSPKASPLVAELGSVC